MSEILNIEELIYNNSSTERVKKDIFSEVLNTCHRQIKRYNNEYKIKECNFTVPTYIFGKPTYNHVDLINYLLSNLYNNGLYVVYMPAAKKLYISWNEKDINYAQYSESKNKNKNNYVTEIAQTPNVQPKKTKKETVESNIILSNFVPVNREKYNQAQKIQQERERFFKNKIETAQLQPTSFNDFMNESKLSR